MPPVQGLRLEEPDAADNRSEDSDATRLQDDFDRNAELNVADVEEEEDPIPRTQIRTDVKCFLAERSDGETCVIVERNADGKRWRFDKRCVEFELACNDASKLQQWLAGILDEQLPGLLTLLAGEVGGRGEKLKALERDRDALRGTEDYDFFGLDGNECTDKDIERAYRKKIDSASS